MKTTLDLNRLSDDVQVSTIFSALNYHGYIPWCSLGVQYPYKYILFTLIIVTFGTLYFIFYFLFLTTIVRSSSLAQRKYETKICGLGFMITNFHVLSVPRTGYLTVTGFTKLGLMPFLFRLF